MKPSGESYNVGIVPVAPRRGAWIETTVTFLPIPAKWSHPAGVRGLKHQVTGFVDCTAEVAPRRGAWIETTVTFLPIPAKWSHPAGVRGLKHQVTGFVDCTAEVAPRRGAWIETSKAIPIPVRILCRTPQGCVD